MSGIKPWILMMLVCLIPAGVFAETPQGLFDQANQAYYKNQLKTAEEIYRKLIGEGIVNGDLYYNLGNIKYRQGEYGSAILNFEKALRLQPRDADARANLKFTEKKRIDNLGETFFMSFLKIFFFWHSWFTLGEMIVIFAVFSGCLWLLTGLNLLFPRDFFRWGTAVFLVISLVIGGSTGFKYAVERVQTWGVVLKPEIEVRPTYLESEKALFKLHEGSKVRVIDEQKFGKKEAWVEVALPQGQKGWVRAEELGIISW